MPPSSADAYNTLTDYNNTRQKTEDIYKGAQDQYDIPGFTSRLSNLRGLVGNLQSSVEAVDPSVTGRTAGTFTTEGQRQALVSKEQAPILGNLSKQQGALGQEQEAYNTASGLASQLASAKINEDQTTYQRLLDQYNTAKAVEAAAEEKRQHDEAMAEQKREFDAQQEATAAQLRANQAAISSAGSYNLGGGSSASADPQQVQAQNALTSLFKTNNVNTIANTIKAITDSANRGNTYDKLKLQLLGNYTNTSYGNLLSQAQKLLKTNNYLAGSGGPGLA